MLIDYKKVNIYQDERQILKDVDFQAGQESSSISSGVSAPEKAHY